MSQYFSKIYRGFLIQQTDKGWIIPQCPTWSNGPVSPGPYGTYQIACHVLDRVLDAAKSPTSTSGTTHSNESFQLDYEEDELADKIMNWFRAIVILAFIGFLFYADLIKV